MAVDRVDADDETKQVVRIESVPLSPEIDPDRFLAGLSESRDKERSEQEKEELSWWDLKREKVKTQSLSSFRRRLGLRKDQSVLEGMVFWVALRGREAERVVHATRAARALSQELYSQLIERASSQAD